MFLIYAEMSSADTNHMNLMEQGLVSDGIPCDRRELRPPAKIHLSARDKVLEVVHLVSLFLRTILYSLALSVWKIVNKLFFQEPCSVAGRVCFVTGSARGLGREICLELARNGAVLACADINEYSNRETVKLIQELGGKAVAYKLNIANRQEVEEVARRVEEDLGPVYLVVCNAALIMPPRDLTEEFVRASYNVNVLGSYWVAQAFLTNLKKRNEGQIIFLGSISSFIGVHLLNIYSSTKAALRSLARSLDMQLRMENSKVKVSIVHPTFVNSTADYTDIIHSRSHFISMKDVVVDVMNAVRYGEQEIIVPSFLRAGLILLEFLPMEAVTFFIKKMYISHVWISDEEYQKLPFGHIVRECSDIKARGEYLTKQ